MRAQALRQVAEVVQGGALQGGVGLDTALAQLQVAHLQGHTHLMQLVLLLLVMLMGKLRVLGVLEVRGGACEHRSCELAISWVVVQVTVHLDRGKATA